MMAGGKLNEVPHGRMNLKVQMPLAWDPGTEPLLVTGRDTADEVLVIKYRGSQRFSVGHSRGGRPMEWSRSLPTEPGRQHTFLVTESHFLVDGSELLPIPGHTLLKQMDAVFLGRDYFGTKGIRGRFTGKILELRIEPSPNR